jgi:RNA polymerase sigma-70 factor (ECF subfamily)
LSLFQGKPELLASFRRGERAALESVYLHYFDHIQKLVRYGLHAMRANIHVPGPGMNDVRDLVQETFVRAFAERARRAYDGKRPYGPFLSSIARNLILDHARRRNREIHMEELPEIIGEVEAPEPWVEPALLREVNAYLGSLPDELRRVHELRYAGTSTQEEAARALGVSRQQLRTLEKKLREGLVQHLRNQDHLQAVETRKANG